jgi:hypothetical protein
LGDKLGKMVKGIFLTILLSYSFIVTANEIADIKTVDVFDKEFSIKKDAQIYTLVGNRDNIELKAKKIAKPSKKSLKLLKAVTPRDKFAIRVLDENEREIMLVGIGNPFYIHADHIGYEDSDVFGGYVETEINLPISLNKTASQIILLSQNEFGFKEIKRLDIN